RRMSQSISSAFFPIRAVIAASIKAIEGLSVLPTTEAVVNAADIFSSQRFKALIEEVREEYDFVVLDAPPTLAVTDSRILAGSADATIFVVRWDDTARDAVQQSLRQFASTGTRITGLVMSMVNLRKKALYGEYTYGYYGSKYGSYYAE
ncbi:MAG: AAA family ATPase, partial [Pseudomonadota bacterium]